MKAFFTISILAFSAAVICYELYAYATRDFSGNPFVTARRLWRRTAGAIALAFAAVMIYFYDGITAYLTGVFWRMLLAGGILFFAMAAVLLALRDAFKTAKIALREQAMIEVETARKFQQALAEKEKQKAKKRR